MMPEEMPTPKKSLKELEREKKQLENKEMKKLEGIKQMNKKGETCMEYIEEVLGEKFI